MSSSSEIVTESEATDTERREQPTAREIITPVSESSVSESPLSEPLLGPPVPSVRQEELAVQDSTAQVRNQNACCHRFQNWMSTKQLFWYTLYCLVVFFIILAIFLVDNPILTITTLVILAVIFTVFLVVFMVRTVRETLAQDRQAAETRALDQEAGSDSPSETLPQSTPEQITTSIESETSSSSIVARNPTAPLKTESLQTSETSSPESREIEEASIDELSSKSDDQTVSEEESVRKRHKSNEKTE